MSSAADVGFDLPSELQSWAANELNLRNLPSEALLRDLTRTPRAAAIWTHLIHRVRSPHHARVIRDAHSLAQASSVSKEYAEKCSRLQEDTRRAEGEADALEKRLSALRAKLDASETSCRDSTLKPDFARLDGVSLRVKDNIAAMNNLCILAVQDAFAGVLGDEQEALLRAESTLRTILISPKTSNDGCRELPASLQQPASDVEGGVSCGSIVLNENSSGKVNASNSLSGVSSPPSLSTSTQNEISKRIDSVHDVVLNAVSAEKCDQTIVGSQILSAVKELAQSYPISEIAQELSSSAMNEICNLQSSRIDTSKVQGCDSEDSDHTSSGMDKLSELRRCQMEAFIDTETVFSEQKRAESILEEEIKEHFIDVYSSSGVREAVLLAQLQGEKAAKTYVEKIWRNLQYKDSYEFEGEHDLDQELEVLSNRVAKNRLELEVVNNLLLRLISESRAFHASINNLGEEISRALKEQLCANCEEVISTAERHHERALVLSSRIKSLNTATDARIFVDGAWVSPVRFRVVHPVGFCSNRLTSHFDSECYEQKCTNPDDELPEIAKTLYRKELNSCYCRARQLQKDKNESVLRALHVRTNYIVDSYGGNSEQMDRNYIPVIEEATEDVRDCVQRLIPSANEDLEIWWKQPARFAAPWHKVQGMSLSELEGERRSNFHGTSRSSPT